MAAARRIQSTALAASAAVSRRFQTTVLGPSIAPGSHPLMSQDLFRSLRHQEQGHVCASSSSNKDIHMMLGLLQQTYLCQQQRPLCASASSSKNVAVGKATAAASEVIKAQKGSLKGHVYLGSLKQLERRILQLEVRSSFYKKIKWVLVGPIIWTLMAISSAVNIYHGVSTEKERQKNTAEKLSNLKKKIEYLEGGIN